MLIRARCACPWRGNIPALAVVACMLACWLAGPAQAQSPLPGAVAPVAAVQQAATASVVPALQPASSPRRTAARVRSARAAVAHRVAPQPAAPSASNSAPTAAPTTVAGTAPTAATTTVAGTAPTTVVTAARRASKAAKSAVESRSKAAAERTSKAAKADGSKAAALREVSKRALAAPQRTVAAARTAPRQAATALITAASGLAPNTLSLLGAIVPAGENAATAQRGSQAVAPTGGFLFSRGGARPAIASSAPAPTAIDGTAGPGNAAASGWRNASTVPVEQAGRTLAGFDAGTSQPSGTASAAASVAGAAATALLGLLGLLSLISQRQGTLVRLRSAIAPAPPFLALPERPG
jgi:S-DNA-T family DNA segregation ATPase FtsK/SpoIIIE